jgi:hypothetical protein
MAGANDLLPPLVNLCLGHPQRFGSVQGHRLASRLRLTRNPHAPDRLSDQMELAATIRFLTEPAWEIRSTDSPRLREVERLISREFESYIDAVRLNAEDQSGVAWICERLALPDLAYPVLRFLTPNFVPGAWPARSAIGLASPRP